MPTKRQHRSYRVCRNRNRIHTSPPSTIPSTKHVIHMVWRAKRESYSRVTLIKDAQIMWTTLLEHVTSSFAAKSLHCSVSSWRISLHKFRCKISRLHTFMYSLYSQLYMARISNRMETIQRSFYHTSRVTEPRRQQLACWGCPAKG